MRIFREIAQHAAADHGVAPMEHARESSDRAPAPQPSQQAKDIAHERHNASADTSTSSASTPSAGASTEWLNPLGTDGFEFVEYTAPNAGELGGLFESMGFGRVARHRSKNVSLYRQGSINFIVNAEPNSLAQRFAREHGPSACAMAFRVRNAAEALRAAVAAGAHEVKGTVGPMELNIPAIEGIGGSLIYLVDRHTGPSIYDIDFLFEPGVEAHPRGVGLLDIDHLTHNVGKGAHGLFLRFLSSDFQFSRASNISTSRGSTPDSPAAPSRRHAERSAFRSMNPSTPMAAGQVDQIQDHSLSTGARAYSTWPCAPKIFSTHGIGYTPTV